MTDHASLPNAQSLPTYQYTALAHSRSIRILHIAPGKFTDPICCSLEETTLDVAVQYDALSYAWGDPIFSQTLLISASPTPAEPLNSNAADVSWFCLKITQSLYDALLHIRREDVTEILWADAVCIDQRNLDERSSQVRIMGQIYHKAACVRVWLGLADTASEVAFDWMEKAFDNIRRIWAEETGLGIERDESIVSLDWCTGNTPFIQSFSDDERVALTKTFSDYGPRKWWTRLWVLQEVAFSQKATLMCGRRSLNWRALADIVLNNYILLCDQKSLPKPIAILLTRMTKMFTGVMNFVSLMKDRGLYDLAFQSHQLPLSEFLTIVKGMAATEPKDYLYAVLPLSHAWSDMVTPDYKKTLIEVYIDGTRAMINEERSLKVLIYARLAERKNERVLEAINETYDLPTWIVDFGNIQRVKSIILYDQYRADDGIICSCSWKNCSLRSIVQLFGIPCDEVVSLVQLQIMQDSSCEVTEPEKFDLERKLSELFDMFESVDFINVLRICFWDCYPRSFEWTEGRRLTNELLERLIPEVLMHRSICFQKVKTWQAESAGRLAISDEGIAEYVDRLTFFRNVLKAGVEERGWHLCTFKSGRIGWVRDTAQPGDLVYVLFGSRMPFVLRPKVIADGLPTNKADIHATIVGPAYVHGIMDGEVVKAASEDDRQVICVH